MSSKTTAVGTKNLGPPALQRPLLEWYDRHKRDLPWRKVHDPYSTFVSEMMLQQTQVKTVIPYYERFLRELPTWDSLAKAREEKVLKLWEGLGYYRRARNLRAAAQMVMKDHKGRLPDSMEEIVKLPGVGPYSAGAVLSIAYGKPHPVVDGNVIRVYSRLFLLRGNLKAGEAHRNLWELAEKMVPSKRPGDFNQALMELGATLCLPEAPQCLLCPLLGRCQAAQAGLQAELPETPKAQEVVEVPMAAVLVEKAGKVLVKKRSEGEKWLKGLWEFPSAEGKTFEEARRKLEKELKVRTDAKELKEVRHQITHHKVELKLLRAVPLKSLRTSRELKWVTPMQLAKLPFASAQGKLRRWILERSKSIQIG